MLPPGLQPYFPADENIDTWIVLRHGHKVYPIVVVGSMMLNDEWTYFCIDHHLRIGCQVVFACEHRWVFNTFLFNEHGYEMEYDGPNPQEPFEQIHAIPDNLHTACLPTIFEHETSLLRFICEFTTQTTLYQAFQNYLHQMIEHFQPNSLLFAVANQTWVIQLVENGMLDSSAFAKFCSNVHFQPFDHVMVSVSENNIVCLIIFQSADGSKKVLNWF